MPATISPAGRHVQAAGGVVVQKEQRLGALDHQIVDAHGDQVDADGVMQAAGDGDLQLGAHAVGGGHQDRVRIPGGAQVEQRAETAEAGGHARAVGRSRERA